MMLITTDELNAHLNDPDWVVFDCRHDLIDTAKGERVYGEGHIPGAFLAGIDRDLSGRKVPGGGRHPLPDKRDFLAFLARCGVTPSSTIVAYDDAGGFFAARLWWMLSRWLGHKRVGLLDGGIVRWKSQNRKLSMDAPSPKVNPAMDRAANSDASVSVDELVSHLGDGKLLVVDARSGDRYRGEVEPMDRVAGHIPGAVSRVFKANLNADLTFRPRNELRREFEELIKSHAPASVVHQCGSGITSCVNLFAMELAGLTGSRLYVGSWSEWVADPARPVAVGASA
ncbi:MAG: sulfurtransferase [Bryobacterales bacterium]|nr:sulfurtransferase [Opitutaceae bacterium]MCZ2155162.1 sulfurtransferase [Bryobacterales bacterium]